MFELAFPQFEKELLKEIEELSILKFYKPGQSLVKKGKPLGGTHTILHGLVKVIEENNKGSEFIITYLKAGDSFAISVSDDSPEANKISILSFTAIEPTHAILMSYANKDMLAKKYDQWYKYILQTAVKYYGFYLNLIDTIAFQKMDGKIEFFLQRLSNIKKTNVLQISHQEIAEGLNSSREVVSRLLKTMEEKGKIKMGHNTIKIISQM